MRIFQADSPLMEGLSRVADLVLLNLVVLVCCLPVFTIGAAMTGMHYVLLKMARDEEGYIVRAYFKSFKQNFLQATGMWLLYLLFLGVFVLDLGLMGRAGAEAAGAAVQFPMILRILIAVGGVYVFLMYLYAFPLLARFQNTVFGTLRNAATLVAAAFPRTLGMAVATIAIPLAVMLFAPLAPVLVLVGFSGPGFICALLYSPVFRKMEKIVTEDNEGQRVSTTASDDDNE